VKTWLFGIAKNEFLNNAKRADNNNLPLENASNAFENDIEHKFGDRFQALEIHKLLHNLDDPYKEIFTLRVFAELKFADIGDIFGKSENWARVTFYRAKEKIIQLIKSETEE
jgi:RNA polymerase sigma-70 factor (ECF subfamily)